MIERCDAQLHRQVQVTFVRHLVRIRVRGFTAITTVFWTMFILRFYSCFFPNWDVFFLFYFLLLDVFRSLYFLENSFIILTFRHFSFLVCCDGYLYIRSRGLRLFSCKSFPIFMLAVHLFRCSFPFHNVFFFFTLLNTFSIFVFLITDIQFYNTAIFTFHYNTYLYPFQQEDDVKFRIHNSSVSLFQYKKQISS